MSGFEVLAFKFDTNFTYVITILQLHPSLSHYVKLQQLVGGGGRDGEISELEFWVYS